MSLQDALDYGKRGFRVFPLLPKSKAPACSHGFHDAVSDETSIRELWGARTNLNIGIATGEQFFVLDIDAKNGGLESLEAWENKYGSLPQTLTSKTGGGGRHYLFKIPKGHKIPSNANKIASGVDIRGSGGYIAAPPSIHPNGAKYEWENYSVDIADAPQWLIKLILAMSKPAAPKAIAAVPVIIGDWSQDDVISMLDYISPDEREIWINVGMALQESGWPVTMWDTWSRGSAKYKMGETFRIWNGFKQGGGVTMGSLVHMAQEGGWVPKERPHEPLDFSNVGGVDLREFKASIAPKVEVKAKTEIGGLIGDTLSWINSSSIKLQPELSIMHIIATLGAVFGRRYALQKLNTRTNIYMVGIAESGQGKDNSRTCLPRLLRAAGLEQFSGPEDIRSGPGLLLELKKQPSFIANIDEFGMFMQALSDKKAAAYLREISTIFTRIYSKSGTFYKGGLIASQPDERTVLNEPNLCIYGTTTISSYAEAMRKSSIESGELNRFIVAKTPTDFPEPNCNSCYSDPPESLVSRWSQFKTEGLTAAPDIIEQEKTIVMLGSMESEVDDLLRFQDKMHKEYRSAGMGALWVRYRENVLKVAMILAITRDPKAPKLIASDVEFGKSLVGGSILFMIKFCTNTMYDSGFQKQCAEFMDAFESGCDTRTKMIRRLQLKTKELDELERSLKEAGRITFDEKERPRRYFV